MQQLLTGKKRLPGFDGEWQTTYLKNIGLTSSGGTPASNNPDYWDGNIAWATPTDITALTQRFISKTARYISSRGLKNSSAKLLPANSLLICTRATVGQSAISEVPMATNQGFKNIVPKTEYDVNFLYYILNYYQKELVRMACGSTFLELSKNDFDKIKLNIPSLGEQKCISNILAAMDKEIDSHFLKLSHLKTEKLALMQQLLTGKRRVKIEEATA